jgi:hypothetical protein
MNLNVPNVALDRVKGWRRTTVATTPARAMAAAVLEPKLGHPGSYRVRMSWGDPVSLPVDTDGGAIEADEISLMFLGPICDEHPPSEKVAGAALDRLLSTSD